MVTMNGMGMTLFGKADVHTSDDSYLATRWFVIFFLPIFPLGTFRVIKLKQEGTRTEYNTVDVPTNFLQIFKTYLFIYGCTAFLIWASFMIHHPAYAFISVPIFWIVAFEKKHL